MEKSYQTHSKDRQALEEENPLDRQDGSDSEASTITTDSWENRRERPSSVESSICELVKAVQLSMEMRDKELQNEKIRRKEEMKVEEERRRNEREEDAKRRREEREDMEARFEKLEKIRQDREHESQLIVETEKSINKFISYKEGQDIVHFRNHFEFEMSRAEVPIKRWKDILSSKLPPAVQVKVTAIIESPTCLFSEIRTKLLETEGLSLQRTWTNLFGRHTVRGNKSHRDWFHSRLTHIFAGCKTPEEYKLRSHRSMQIRLEQQ